MMELVPLELELVVEVTNALREPQEEEAAPARPPVNVTSFLILMRDCWTLHCAGDRSTPHAG
jgi:hypothetical protein